jgi:ABC-type transport system involved in cytochrome c biogenesis permease subunit
LLIELYQLSAALYLVAAIAGFLGLALPQPRLSRFARGALVAGVVVHGLAFARLHTLPSPPPLSDLGSAVSLTAWLAVIASLGLLRRGRLEGLAAAIAPLAFLAVFFEGLTAGRMDAEAAASAGRWAHLHIILASAGLALLAVAGVAGGFFLLEDRALKAKRRPAWRGRLPSLEALDRVNAAALASGFPLLTCGVIAGMLWTRSQTGRLWVGDAHAVWASVGWAIYLALVVMRFGIGWRGREAAACAAFGFAFLLFVVVGVGAIA